MDNKDKAEKYSLRRAALVGNYYTSRLRWQVMFYPLISLLFFAMSMVANSLGSELIGMTLTGFLQYLVIFGPIVFAIRRNDVMEATIPASSAEKSTFLAVYCLIILPVLALAPCEIATQLVYGKSILAADLSSDTNLSALELNTTIFTISSLLQIIFGASVCMWVVTAARKSPVMKGILFTIAANFVIGMAVGIVVAVNVVKTTLNSPRLHRMPNINYEALGETMNSVYTWLIPLLSILIIFAIWRTFRAMSKR